jgi:hypothetical protein
MSFRHWAGRSWHLWCVLTSLFLGGSLLLHTLNPPPPRLPPSKPPRLLKLHQRFQWKHWSTHTRWRWKRRFWHPQGHSSVRFVWDRKQKKVEARWRWKKERWRVLWVHASPLRFEVWRQDKQPLSPAEKRRWFHRSRRLWQETALAQQPLLLLYETGVKLRWRRQKKHIQQLWLDASKTLRFAGIRALWSWSDKEKWFRWQRWVRGERLQGAQARVDDWQPHDKHRVHPVWLWKWRGWRVQKLPSQRWFACSACRLPALSSQADILTPATSGVENPSLWWGKVWGVLWLLLGGGLLFWRRQTKGKRRIRFPSPVEHPFRYAVVTPGLCPPALCEALCHEANAGTWTQQRHTQPTQDQPLASLSDNRAQVEKWLREVAFAELAKDTGISQEMLAIREAFVIRYDEQQAGLDLHRDASILTLSVALNSQHEYEGGGTYFTSLHDVVSLPEVGDMLWHCGKLQHGGAPVKSGVRMLLVCFVDTSACELFRHKEIAEWDSETPDDTEVMRRLLRGD